jgi:sRNA-binding protein
MFDMLRRDAALCALLTAVIAAITTPSFAQGPSEAQKQAVKSACRSDYMAHCSSVQPGGEAALQCLANNMSSLSSSCQSAVRAVQASVAPKNEPAKSEEAPAAAPKSETTAAEPKAESKPAATAAKKPSSAQISAIRSACRGDYMKVCAGVPTGGAPALECLEKNKASVSAACGRALAAASGTTAPAASVAPAAVEATPAAAPVVIVLRPMRPREELFVIRSACGADIRSLCAGVEPGGGRIMQCIANRAADLSPACREVLAPFAAR